MKPKKASAEWYISATHWLTAGFVIPLLIAIVAGIILGIMFGESGVPYTEVVVTLISIISIWLGVIYSSKYLDKTYVIKNSVQITILSTVYLAVLGGLSRIILALNQGAEAAELNEIIRFVLVVLVFYIASRKYIKNNVTATESPVM